MSEIYVCRCGEKTERCVQCLDQTCNRLREEKKDLQRQLAEAIKIAENAIKNWGDTAYSYGSYSDEIDLEKIKLNKLKEKGDGK